MKQPWVISRAARRRLTEATAPISRATKPAVRAATTAVDATIGPQRRKAALERAVAMIPVRVDQTPDVRGWTAPEYLAWLPLPRGSAAPAQRAGRETVRRINALAGSLPRGAVPLARSITDAAPPAGARVNQTLHFVLERYLPQSLDAFDTRGPKALRANAERLLMHQLHLLAQVTRSAQQAEAADNEQELRAQELFLKQRFEELTPNSLELPDAAARATPARVATGPIPSTAPPGGAVSTGPAGGRSPYQPAGSRKRRPTAIAPPRGRVHCEVDVDPVVLFPGPPHTDERMELRLALTKGQVAVLGVVFETSRGDTGFHHTASRRWLAPKRKTGFQSPQVDLMLRFALSDLRRFVVYVTGRTHADPIETVLFLSSGTHGRAQMPTIVVSGPTVRTTVVASGYFTDEGLILRNESSLHENLREACAAYGFGTITWLDDQTPVV